MRELGTSAMWPLHGRIRPLRALPRALRGGLTACRHTSRGTDNAPSPGGATEPLSHSPGRRQPTPELHAAPGAALIRPGAGHRRRGLCRAPSPSLGRGCKSA